MKLHPFLAGLLLTTVAACSSATTPKTSSQAPNTAAATPAFPGQQLPPGSVTLHLSHVTGSTAGPDELAANGSAVWVSDGLFKIDPASNAISPGLDTAAGDDSASLAVDASSVWGSDYTSGVRRYDIATGKLEASIGIGTADGIAITSNGVWVALHHGGTVIRIDPATNKIVARVRLTSIESSGPQGVAAGLGSVWVGVPNQNAVFRVDARTDRIAAKILFPSAASPCGDLSVSATSVWVTECLDGTHVFRIDAATNNLTALIDTRGEATAVAADAHGAWYVTGPDPESQSTQPAYLEHRSDSGALLRRIDLGAGFLTGGIVIAFGSIWVSTLSAPVVLRIPLAAVQ